MKTIRCLLLEDEPLAAEVLAEYIGQVPFLDLRAVCPDALFALDVLQREPIDLIFLDIHLPKMKGLDFIRTLTNPPRVIVVSAYSDYALQGYELNVVDYLLKPVEWSRFLMAVNKLQAVPGKPLEPVPATRTDVRPHLFFNVNKRRVKVCLDEILYIESLREYIRISTHNRSILTKYPLSEIEELLQQNHFLRIHRSFIVAQDKIDTFSATDVEVGGKQLPIGRIYKEAVLAALDAKL
ncbi:MAG: response regulator transcription factor [Chitinophagaceae bacterium]|nr:MAG: response regulator transcription factor [Chitinophagaceae bacterium]